jgi:hypothetical protein
MDSPEAVSELLLLNQHQSTGCDKLTAKLHLCDLSVLTITPAAGQGDDCDPDDGATKNVG